MKEIILVISLGLALCAAGALYSSAGAATQEPGKAGIDLNCGFTDDFTDFLKNSAYAGWDFARNDIECAAYGGKAYPNEKINRTPVIFVHGNGDIGFGRGLEDGHLPDQTGLRELAKYLGAQGYTKAELYTTTWGPGSMALAALNNHKKEYVLQMRNFVEAVLAYTGASQVNIIGHSMGVTLGRKIVKGGKARDHVEGTYNVGDSLKSRVKTFIGIAGGNLGVATCRGAEGLPTCNRIDGFDPGLTIISGPSEFLTDLNNGGGTEGSNIYSIWSKYDEYMVWGKVTCRIPGQDGQVVKNSIEYTHIGLRDKTGPDLIGWL